jgi:hypothetical protein
MTAIWPRLVGKGAGMRDVAFRDSLNRWGRGFAGSDSWTSTRARWRVDGGCNDPVSVVWGRDRTLAVGPGRGGRLAASPGVL